MLILLPPSEGKAAPRRGAAARPRRWAAGLTEPRERVLAASSACAGRPGRRRPDARARPHPGRRRTTQRAAARRRHRAARSASTPACSTTPSDLATPRRRGPPPGAWPGWRSPRRCSGWSGPGDRIRAYRLSGDVALPGLGAGRGHWRDALDPASARRAGSGLVVDLRSSTYASFWRPPADLAPRVVTVRVLHEVDGRRQVVSHFNKATKGRLVRALLEDGARRPRTPARLADLLGDLGWTVEVGPPRPRAPGSTSSSASSERHQRCGSSDRHGHRAAAR